LKHFSMLLWCLVLGVWWLWCVVVVGWLSGLIIMRCAISKHETQ
jgi:hypothetical protein